MGPKVLERALGMKGTVYFKSNTWLKLLVS